MASVASVAPSRDDNFYPKMAMGLAAFILFGFVQFAARGFVDYRAVPAIVHVHALAMTAWLALFVVQATLAQRIDRTLHMRIGWASLLLVIAIPPLAIATCVTMLRVHAVPPFFTPAYFLSLVTIGGISFAGVVLTAVALRRRSDWHRRLMIAATILLMEPALGRLLPMPLLGDWGEWVAMVVQLLTFGFLVRHDRRGLGRVHDATVAGAATVVLMHVAVSLVAMLPGVEAVAAGYWG